MNSIASLYIKEIKITSFEVEVKFLKCPLCQITKPLNEFFKDRYREYGINSSRCKQCYDKKYGNNWNKSSYNSNGNKGHWTKWGGKRIDLDEDKLSTIWYCQSCGKPSADQLTPYRIEYIADYLRVCAECLNNKCIQLKQRIGF